MYFSGTRTIESRDAAVASALAGTVVVILGYGSGLGIQMPAVAASQSTAPASPPAVSAAPPVVPPPGDAMATTPMPDAVSTGHTTAPSTGMAQHPGSHTPPDPAGSTSPRSGSHPAAPGPAPDCPAAPLAGVPVAGTLTTTASSLLFAAGSSPIPSRLVPAPGNELDRLTCTVGAVLPAGVVR